MLFVTASIILALSIYKLKIVLLKSDYIRRNQIVNDINAESILSETYASYLLGEKSPFDKLNKDIRIQKLEYQLKLVPDGKRDFYLEVSSAFYKKSLRFSVVPITDFFRLYEKDLSLSFSDTKTRIDSPIYAPNIFINLQNASLEASCDYKSLVPNLVAGENLKVSFSGSNSVLVLSKILGELGGSPLRYKNEEFRGEISGKSSLMKEGVRLELGRMRFRGVDPLIISKSFQKKKVLNPYLNTKTFLFTASSSRQYSAPALKEVFQEGSVPPRIYIVPPSAVNQVNQLPPGQMLLNPWLYADFIGFEPSYSYADGAITFADESRKYQVQVSEEMVVGPNRIQLGSSKTGAISVGRRISHVFFGNADTEVPFEYDEGTRILKISTDKGLSFLSYGDGRKTDFSYNNNLLPKVYFVDGKKVSAQIVDSGLGGKLIRFEEAPGYGKAVQLSEDFPPLFIVKERILSGSWVFSDAVEEAADVELSRIGMGSHDSVYSPESIYIRGEISYDIKVESEKDIYLGDLSLTHKLSAKGRLVFIDSPKNKNTDGLYRNLVLSTSGEEILSLQGPGTQVTIQGSFLFSQRIKSFSSGDSGPVGAYSILEATSPLKLGYDTGFVSSPSRDLLVYVRR